MCGICGIIQVDGPPRDVTDQATLDLMTDALTHRGPNERGTHLAPGVALGVRRLSIVDVAHGQQPVRSEAGDIWAIQNGELYNHEDVRRDLAPRGHVFASSCDTEIIPHLYEEAGSRFAERLRGKFAIAVFDERRRTATLARDRLGVKPLYYARRGDLLLFSSELKSLLAGGLVDVRLDYEAIDAYLTLGFFPYPSTPLAGVSKLPPAHTLVVRDGEVSVEPYWRYPEPNEVGGRSEREWADELVEQLEDAVRSRLMSDVPLGAMLSGGLDSSLIVALMARNMTEPVKTFSVGFTGEGVTSELADARLVARALGTDHYELELPIDDPSVDLAEVVWALDEPLADLSALGFYSLSRLASEHVTVALSGQGADELLGGYQKHRAAAVAERWQRLPRPARQLGEAAMSAGSPRWQRMGRTLAAADPAARLMNMSAQLDESLRRRLYIGPMAEVSGNAGERAVRGVFGNIEAPALAATLYGDAQLALVDDMLHYFDRVSMAHSLEVRVPFLDHHLVEFCATVPTSLKVRGLTTKYLLKQAARGLVPDQIIDKRKIGFFHGAISQWFRVHVESAVGTYLRRPDAAYADLLDRRQVEGLIDTHAGDASGAHGRLLLAILVLEVWLSSLAERVPQHAMPAERISLPAA